MTRSLGRRNLQQNPHFFRLPLLHLTLLLLLKAPLFAALMSLQEKPT